MFVFKQLKAVGEFSGIINEIKQVGSVGEISSVSLSLLSKSLEGLSASEIMAKVSTMGLTDAQRLELIQLYATDAANYTTIASVNALAASEKAATVSTLGLGTAFKGLGASIKSLALAHPVLTAIAALGATIYGAVKAYDALTVSVEEANEAMNDAVSEYSSAKSNLESINSELEENKKQMDALLAKDNLTYAEKGQLEELQAITRELLIQQDIEEKRAEKASKEAADKTVDAYEKQYGKHTSREELDDLLDSDGFHASFSENDIVSNISDFVKAQEKLNQFQKDFEEASKNGEDTTWFENNI